MSFSLARASHLMRLLFGQVSADDLRRRRLIAVVQGAVTNLSGRLVGIMVSFLSVPLTISYLGQERYGAWITMAALLAWLQLTDFGVGNGLTTAVSTAFGQDRPDLVRRHVSNALFLLSGVAAVTGVAAVIVWPYIDWAHVFGLSNPAARQEISQAVAFALAIVLLQFPLSVPSRVFNAMQEGRIGNYWSMFANVLSLGSLLLVTRFSGGLVLLVLSVSGTWLLVNIATALWLFRWHKPWLSPRLSDVNLSAMGALCKVGGSFFLLQCMSLVTLQTDTLVISHYLGAAEVPAYSLTYNLFNYTALLQSVMFSYLWAAYSEAKARGDFAWIRRTFHMSLLAGMSCTAVAVAILAAIAQPFVTWWSGNHITPPTSLIHWMAAWSLIGAFVSSNSCLLAGAGHLRAQTIYSAFATVTNVVLSILLVQRWGVTGVIAGTVIAYIVFVCVPVIIDSELLLRRLMRLASPAARTAEAD